MEAEKPDPILHNGDISTMNKEPRAQAIATSRRRIIAVGSDADVLRLVNAATKKIDLSAKTVLPGFIAAQSHPAMAGVMHLRMVSGAGSRKSR